MNPHPVNIFARPVELHRDAAIDRQVIAGPIPPLGDSTGIGEPEADRPKLLPANRASPTSKTGISTSALRGRPIAKNEEGLMTTTIIFPDYVWNDPATGQNSKLQCPASLL